MSSADGHHHVSLPEAHGVCGGLGQVELAAGKSEVNLHGLCLLKIVLGPTP